MKTRIVATMAALLIGATVPVAAVARPYTPHHTSAGVAHHRHGPVGHVGRAHGITKAERVQRRENTHRYGNPNARNPEREGYQQQLGNTTNGPRY